MASELAVLVTRHHARLACDCWLGSIEWDCPFTDSRITRGLWQSNLTWYSVSDI